VSPSGQRILALALLALAIGLGWLAVVQPIADAFAAQGEDIARAHQLLAAYDQKIAMRPIVEARLREMKQHEASSTGLIGGASAELAAANIQNIVKALIESESGQVHSAQNLTPVSDDGFQRVEIQYDLSLPMRRLKDATYRIETSVPYLFLDGIDMRAPENWQSMGGQALDPPNLEIRWTVHGYRWIGAQ
jgi:Type II secretion system (T2SS), protein M subtype b